MMKTIILILLLGIVNVPVFAAQESAIDQVKDAAHAGKKAESAKCEDEARDKAGNQFQREYDRPANTPEANAVPPPSKPEKVE